MDKFLLFEKLRQKRVRRKFEVISREYRSCSITIEMACSILGVSEEAFGAALQVQGDWQQHTLSAVWERNS